MSILAQQTRNLKIKPKWWGSLGMVESIVRYNCMKRGFPVPVLAMPFWEGAGNRAFDVSGKMNHGTLTNIPKWVAGMRGGSALLFDGTNDYVSVLDSPLHDPGNALSVAAWIFPINVCDADSIILHDLSDYKWLLYASGGTVAKVDFYVQTTTGFSNTGYNANDLRNGWHYVVGTYDKSSANRLKLYVDGILEKQTIGYNENILDGDEGIHIGTKYNALVSGFPGRIDEIQYYNCALTAAQVKYAYNNPYFIYDMPEELWGYAAAVGGLSIPVAMHHYKQQRARC